MLFPCIHFIRMTANFLVGLFGSLVLVAGAALPDHEVRHPALSAKNRCFSLGAVIMLVYSVLNYLSGAPVFFIMLEALVVAASACMMLNVSEKVDTPIIIVLSLILILWSLKLFDGYGTIVFIVGLCGVAIGYVSKIGTVRREVALLLGSALIALFSYLTATWIFFWLNVFFAAFSGWYAWKERTKPSA